MGFSHLFFYRFQPVPIFQGPSVHTDRTVCVSALHRRLPVAVESKVPQNWAEGHTLHHCAYVGTGPRGYPAGCFQRQAPAQRPAAPYGGHTHYVIARNGATYRVVDKAYVADHAGISMWEGQTDISKVSIGIELVGYHYDTITQYQYRSVGLLIDVLQGVYGLDDRSVLTHSQVAYGRPNRWFKKNHRGRKRCAKNFIRAKAELGPTWNYDPDVRAGRLIADPQLAEVFYGRAQYYAEGSVNDANVISKTNSAWSIAGEDYDSSTTVYKFPDGRLLAGDQISGPGGLEPHPGPNRSPVESGRPHNVAGKPGGHQNDLGGIDGLVPGRKSLQSQNDHLLSAIRPGKNRIHYF